MPRFFLHQRSATHSIHDPEGSELPDIVAAREEAIDSARELMSEAMLDGFAPDYSWQFEITNESGIVLAIVPFKSALRAK
jgi:hypothetical protein